MNPSTAGGHRASAASQAIEAALAAPGAMDQRRFSEFLQLQREVGLVHGERPLCHHLSPFVISTADYRRIGRAAEHVVAALGRVASRSLEDISLANALGLTTEEQALAAIDPGYPELLAVGRLDMLMHESGFSFIELNADSPGGIVDQMLVERTLFELPHLSPMLGQEGSMTPKPHEALRRALLDVYASSGRSGSPTIALVDFATTDTRAEIEVLARSFSRDGCRAFFADPGELRYDGHRLTAHGGAIDLVYRRVIVGELLKAHGLDNPLVRAYRDGAVCVANSFRTKALDKKAAFAVLSDPEYAHLFSGDQLRAIAAHVPWTRRVERGPVDYHGREIDMRELLEGDRARFVLKPNDDYGGRGVVLGWTATAEQWTRALSSGGDGALVAQERQAAKTVRMPAYRGDRVTWEDVYFDVCPFVFGGQMEGGIVRLSATDITNVSAGACVSTLLVVDGERASLEEPPDV
jgi:hypothetical protein